MSHAACDMFTCSPVCHVPQSVSQVTAFYTGSEGAEGSHVDIAAEAAQRLQRRALLARLRLPLSYYPTLGLALPRGLLAAAAACSLPDACAYELLLRAPPAAAPLPTSDLGLGAGQGARHGKAALPDEALMGSAPAGESRSGMPDAQDYVVEVAPAPAEQTCNGDVVDDQIAHTETAATNGILGRCTAPAAPGAETPDLALPVAPAAQLAAVAALRREVAAKRAAMRGDGDAAADIAAANAASAAKGRAPCATVLALQYRAGQKAAVAAVTDALGVHAGGVAAAAAAVANRVWLPAENTEPCPGGDVAAAGAASCSGWDAALVRMGVSCRGIREIAPPGCANFINSLRGAHVHIRRS